MSEEIEQATERFKKHLESGFYRDRSGKPIVVKESMSEEISREQAIEYFKSRLAVTVNDYKEPIKMAIAALSAEQDYKDFAEYVAMLIFEYDLEMDMETFSELACRKLAKLGIVKANGDKWERVK